MGYGKVYMKLHKLIHLEEVLISYAITSTLVGFLETWCPMLGIICQCIKLYTNYS